MLESYLVADDLFVRILDHDGNLRFTKEEAETKRADDERKQRQAETKRADDATKRADELQRLLDELRRNQH